MSRLFPVILAVAAAVYFAQAYVPVGLAYWRVQRAARAYTQASLAGAGAERGVDGLIAAVRRDAGVQLDPGAVRVRREGDAVSAVLLRFEVPLQFPLVGGGRTVRFAIAAGPRGEE